MINDDFEPVELFVVVAKGKAGDMVLSQELDYTDAMAKLTVLKQYRRSVRLEFTGYAPWINPAYLKGNPQAVKKRAKLSRVLGKRALKSFHPRLFNVRFFSGESWSVSNGRYCRNQTAFSCRQ